MSTARTAPRNDGAAKQASGVAPYLRLFAAQIAIGAAAIFARFALTGTGTLGASALRLLIATVPLAALALVRRGQSPLGRRAEIALAAAGILLAVHFGTWIGSLQYTSVTISTLLVCTSPVWTGLYDAVVLRHRPDRAFAAALAFAAAGLVLVASRTGVAAPVAGKSLLGASLALGGGISIAAYLLIVERVRSAGGADLNVRRIVVRTYGWAAIALALAAAASGQRPPALDDGVAWFGIIAMALVSQLVGHTALNAALRDFSPSTVAMSTLLEPVAAAVLAAVIFRESATPLTALGGCCILVAVALAARSGTIRPTAQSEGPL